ncbi:MAG TPA: hypothetical protein PLW45_00545 [Anaerolineaceae bacterium]|nr:hypothetical protein [Anaerolineaceae bacterium]
MKNYKFYPARTIIVLLIISLMTGCGLTTVGDPTATSSAPTLPPAQPTIIMVNGTPQVVYGEQFQTPTANLQDANPVQLTELKFIQNGTKVTLFAKIRNTVSDAIAKDVFFEIYARDINGNRLYQDTTMVKYIFPQEITGLSHQFELMPGFVVNNIELRVMSGVLDHNLKYSQPLEITMPSLQKTESKSTFTAWLENTDPYTYTQVRLNAIAYNKNNEIIGGGTSIVDFVPHKDKIGVSIPVEALSEREIAWVEIYPWITQYSASLQAGKWWDTIEVKDWNFEVNGSMQFSGGAVLQNLSKHLVTDTYYNITLSDELGRVVLSDTGYVDYIWPEEEILFASALQDVPFTEYFPDTSPSATQEPSATPQARGFGGLARPMSQDTYPIETPTNTPEPTEIVETPEPPGDDSTPESPTDETTSPEQTPTPTATADPNLPKPIRVYPERFTVDLIIVPGEFGSSQLGYNPLSASQAALTDDNQARVSVVNNLSIDLQNALIYVLVYNEDGQIVGGGQHLSETIKSASATEVIVPVAYHGDRENLSLKAFATLPKEALNLP